MFPLSLLISAPPKRIMDKEGSNFLMMPLPSATQPGNRTLLISAFLACSECSFRSFAAFFFSVPIVFGIPSKTFMSRFFDSSFAALATDFSMSTKLDPTVAIADPKKAIPPMPKRHVNNFDAGFEGHKSPCSENNSRRLRNEK